MGKPNSTDCLTLNKTSGQWERGTSFTNGLLGDGVRGVINMEGNGVFVIHSHGMSVLATGSETWVAGPLFPSPAECGCNVSSTSFVTIHLSDTENVREYTVTSLVREYSESVTTSPVTPEPIDSWPSLLTKRHGPGCGATSYHLIVAGGVSDLDEVLASVEIFNIKSKALMRGGLLRHARAFFQIIPVGSTHHRLLAVGGQNGASTVGTSEWWEEEEDSWEEGPTLSKPRSNFAALMAPPHLVCPEIDPHAHSCPTALNTEQTCVFPSVESGSPAFTITQNACHSIDHKFHNHSHSNTGDTVNVCQSRGDEFICPTVNTNLACDTTRCPLQGPPMSPILEPQSSGLIIKAFPQGWCQQ